MTEYVVRGADEMRALGARLAQALCAAPMNQSVLVTLAGELGAGFTRQKGQCKKPDRYLRYQLHCSETTHIKQPIKLIY
jgi:hypothetical protein